MLSIALAIAFAAIGVAMAITFWRLVVGPSAVDRILALDTLYLESLAFVIVLGIALGSSAFFEAALLVALMGFVSTVALAKFLLRGDVVD
jgi:multicomponent K+:H+ antiporter subunit F